MRASDRKDFVMYLERCTDRQVIGVLAKERAAKRWDYARLAKTEAQARKLDTDTREVRA